MTIREGKVMGIGNITSKLASGAKEVAKTFKETSAPKMKSYVQHKTNAVAEMAKDAYGRAAVKFSKETDAEKIKKLTTKTVDMADDLPLNKQVKCSKSFWDNTKYFGDKNGDIIGSYGNNTMTCGNKESFTKSLIKETIKNADGTLYKSADELTSEAEKGAKAV